MLGAMIATRNLRLLAVLTLILPIFGACFDYSEVIHFNDDFSGYVSIHYDVPISLDGERSMVGFLPVTEDGLREKYGTPVKIKRDKIILKDKNIRFTHRMKIAFEIRFDKPGRLREILLGEVVVRFKSGKLKLLRTFPRLRKYKKGEKPGGKQLKNLTVRTLRKHSLSFGLHYPVRFQLESSRGHLIQPGRHYFEFPLSSTLREAGKYIWRLELRPL